MARPGIYTKNTEKIPLGPKFWNPKKIPQKYRKNTKNTPFWYFGGIFLVFSGYFGGKFWESRISGRGVFSWYFSWKFQVGPFRSSVAGRGVLNHIIITCTFFLLRIVFQEQRVLLHTKLHPHFSLIFFRNYFPLHVIGFLNKKLNLRVTHFGVVHPKCFGN